MRNLSIKAILLVPTLIALSAAGEDTRAHGVPPVAVQFCIAGLPDELTANKCVSELPDQASTFERSLRAYRRNNAPALKKFDRFCRAYIKEFYDIYAINDDEKNDIRTAATTFIDQWLFGDSNRPIDQSRCDAHIETLSTIRTESIEIILSEIKEMPPSILFVHGHIRGFRLKPPNDVNANYQRDRNWDYGDTAWRVKRFSVAHREVRHSRCIRKSVEECVREYGRPPDSLNDSGGSRQEMVYFGEKLLYDGHANENHSIGREAERLLVENGVITEHQMTIQVIEWTDIAVKSYGLIDAREEEPYGEKIQYSSPRHSAVE